MNAWQQKVAVIPITRFAFMQPLLINVCKEFLKGMVNKNKPFDNTSPFEK